MRRRSDIDAQKFAAVEQVNADANGRLDAVCAQLQESVDRIVQLETELEQAQTPVFAAGSPDQKDVPRMVRLHQQRADLLQQQLQQKAANLLDMRRKRAEDAKAMIRLQRELDRSRNDLRLQLIRFDAAKSEVDLFRNVVRDRDNTIRLLNREIERLRALLSAQDCLGQQTRLVTKEKNDTREAILKVRKELRQAAQTSKSFQSQPAVSSYIDGMMQRQQERLNRLEQKRRDFMAMEEATKIARMQVFQHIVRPDELEIPEAFVLKMMPKPPRVRNLKRRQVVIESPVRDARGASYAESLKQIGEIAGKMPTENARELLRNARAPTTHTQAPAKKAGKRTEILPGFSVTPLLK
jgi:chromosome segregation ATPase